MFDLDRHRENQADARPIRPARTADRHPAFLGRVTSPASAIAPGKFLMVRPRAILGTEAEGSAGAASDLGTVDQAVYLVSGTPATGDELVCRYVDYRWVARRRGTTGSGTADVRCYYANNFYVPLRSIAVTIQYQSNQYQPGTAVPAQAMASFTLNYYPTCPYSWAAGQGPFWDSGIVILQSNFEFQFYLACSISQAPGFVFNFWSPQDRATRQNTPYAAGNSTTGTGGAGPSAGSANASPCLISGTRSPFSLNYNQYCSNGSNTGSFIQSAVMS